jgi:CheY-like chemotaxis protein
MTAAASDRPPAAGGEPTPTRWILVVDDDEATRLAIEEVLIDEGYLVRTAQHGQDALEILRTGKPPALVVVDMMMPVMDGWAFIGVMRQEPTLADVGVVAMSAGGNGLLAMAPVSSDYLPKPVNLERLLGTVRRFCGCPGAPPSWKSSGSYARDLDAALDEPEVD